MANPDKPASQPSSALADPRRTPDRLRPSDKERIAAALFNRPPPKTLVGRYEVGTVLGRGAMGVVYEGVDEDLDRTIAIKLVFGSAAEDPEVAVRIRREAQALAKLSHPNVVAIHEIGEHDGQLFIAMELVRGSTIREWLRGDRRPWQDTLEVFVQAGRGLAAAHDVGLVHRDFKPANCILGDDGRVRVLDFGLARGTAGRDGLVDASGATSLSGTALDETVTATGAVVGTPAYMAPEQLRGDAVDAASDQFAFCVSLYEALVGSRPFSGRSRSALYQSIMRGAWQETSARRLGVPAGLLTLVGRGLHAEPAQRWPSMTPLLDALERHPARSRSRRRVAAAGAVTAVGVMVVAAALAESPCASVRDLQPPGWSEDERAALHSAVASAGPRATLTWSSFEAATSDWAEQWRAGKLEVCLQAHNASDEARPAALQSACLDRRGETARALLRGLTKDDAAWEHAPSVAQALPPLDACLDAARVLAVEPPLPEAADEVKAAREALDGAAAAWITSDRDEVVRLVDEAAEHATTSEYRPVLAKVGLHRGRLLSDRDAEAAETAFVEAMRDAELGADDLTGALAAIQLVHLAARAGRTRAGEQFRALAQAKLERAGAGPIERSQLYLASSELAHVAMDDERATADADAALDLLRGTVGGDHLLVATALGVRAIAVESDGRAEAADRAHDAAVQAMRKSLGEHPWTARAVLNRGFFRFERGDGAGANLDLDSATAILERTKAEPRLLADARMAAVVLASMEGDLDASAVARATEPLAALPEDDPARLDADEWRAAFVLRLGYPERALRLYEGVLETRRRGRQPQPVELAMLQSNIGECLLALDRLAEAKPRFEAALTELDRTLPTTDMRLAYPLAGLGAVAVHDDRLDDARGYFERALPIAEANPGDSLNLASIQWGLAQALAEADAERAQLLAAEAAVLLRELGDEGRQTLADVEAHLATNLSETTQPNRPNRNE